MVGLSLVAMLYIFVGGLGFLLNMMATAFLVSKPEKPLLPLTIYGLSDTLSGALTSTALFCDGILYFANLLYRNSCSRYFLIYTLLVFPVVISNFSILGVATERHQVTTVAIPKSENFRRTFSLVWTVASWFIALAFIIMLWGHTMVFSVKGVNNNVFYWENEEIRHNRGLLEDLWEHNSQQDWSSDYRENVIIGLIYGIVGGNISHTTLEQFRGTTPNEQSQPINQQRIKELHAALGITNEDLQRVFGEELNENSQNINQRNDTIHHDKGNPTENKREAGTLPAQTLTNLKAFKPSSAEIVEHLTNNSSKHASNTLQIKNVTPHGDLPEQISQSSPTNRPPTTVTLFSLRDTETLDKHDVKQPNKSEMSSPAGVSETLSSTNIFNILTTRGESQLITNPETHTTSLPQVNEETSSQALNTEITSPVTVSDVDEHATKTTQIYMQQSTEVPGEGHNSGSETANDEKLSPTTVALSNEVTSDTISSQVMQFQSSTEFYNDVSKLNSNITSDELQVLEVTEFTKTPDKNETGFSLATKPSNLTKNFSIHSSNTLSGPPLTTTEEIRSTNAPSTTNFSTACQTEANFLPTFMTVLFVLAFTIPISVSAGLYTHTAWILYHQNPPESTDMAYAHWSCAKRTTCQMVVMLLANLGCWTPFMVERLLYTWGVINNLTSVVPALLFLLGHTYSLLRGVFYILHHAVGRVRISAMSTAAMCNSGCISSTIPMDEVALHSSGQASPSGDNTLTRGNAPTREIPVTQDVLLLNADDASSSSLRGSRPPPTSSNFNRLPNTLSNISISSNKRNR